MSPEEKKFLEEYTKQVSPFDGMNKRYAFNLFHFPFEIVRYKFEDYHWYDLNPEQIIENDALSFCHHIRGPIFYRYPKVNILEHLFDEVGSERFTILEQEDEEPAELGPNIYRSSTSIGFESKDDLMKLTLSI